MSHHFIPKGTHEEGELPYYAFFVYGYCIRPFNHYLVWPRLAGCLLLLGVLAEIARDRTNRVAAIPFVLALAFVAGGMVFLAISPTVVLEAQAFPQSLSVVVAVLIAQSLVHQIRLIRASGHPGAVSPTLHFFTATKDASTVAFGFAMGLSTGWPLVLMGGSSAALKAFLLYQFRWASRSPVAAVRRPTLMRPPVAHVSRPPGRIGCHYRWRHRSAVSEGGAGMTGQSFASSSVHPVLIEA